jgi:protein TonB
VRLRSPFVLALVGTLVSHAIFLAGAHAVTELFPPTRRAPTPRIELVEIEAPPVLKPPPPPVKAPEPEPPPEPPKEAPKPPAVRAVQPDVSRPPPPPEQPPPPAEPEPQLEPEPDLGGAPTVAMPDLAPSATGVAVASGPRNTGKTGRGGRGTGTGTGTGAGTGGDPPPKPVSIATIKTFPRARGDYDYTNDYPDEARRLGIEGIIRVQLLVDSSGKVKTAALLNRLGHGLDELALSRAKKLEFEPAVDTEGRTVEAPVVWTFTMVLPK